MAVVDWTHVLVEITDAAATLLYVKKDSLININRSLLVAKDKKTVIILNREDQITLHPNVHLVELNSDEIKRRLTSFDRTSFNRIDEFVW